MWRMAEPTPGEVRCYGRWYTKSLADTLRDEGLAVVPLPMSQIKQEQERRMAALGLEPGRYGGKVPSVWSNPRWASDSQSSEGGYAKWTTADDAVLPNPASTHPVEIRWPSRLVRRCNLKVAVPNKPESDSQAGPSSSSDAGPSSSKADWRAGWP